MAALSSLRGIDFVAAVTLAAEIGDFSRFAHPTELMGFLGLVPSEYSSGDTHRQGAITKTGNGHARRVLVEAAWNYRFPARISRILQIRQEGQPKVAGEIVKGRSCAWRICHLSTLELAQTASEQDLRGDCTRAHRFYLGHRAPGESGELNSR